MNRVVLLKTVILGCMSILSLSQCQENPTTPQTKQGCGYLGYNLYNCEDGAPGDLVHSGKGKFKLAVISDQVPQFSQVLNWNPPYTDASNNFIPVNPPSVMVQNGTVSSGNQSLFISTTQFGSSKIIFDIPGSDNYLIKGYYIEYGSSFPSYSQGNTATCSNPETEKCRRWYKMLQLFEGSSVDCQNNLTIMVDSQDPDGFVGSCN